MLNLMNISKGGCRLIGQTHARPGNVFMVTLGVNKLRAVVKWAYKDLVGVAFENSVSPEILNAFIPSLNASAQMPEQRQPFS